jgi:peptide/nickel transport system substrate-binding protein
MTLKAVLTGATAAALTATLATMLNPTAASAERGSDGRVDILFWQAVSILNPYLASGAKDLYAASLVLEPMARYDETGALVPFLAEAIPTVENGGVSEDLTAITWTLKEGLVWSDGAPVSAEDAVFTSAYCMDEAMGCAYLANFADVEAVEALDARTVRVTFSRPKPFPYGPFVGAQSPILQKAQFQACMGARAAACTDENFYPIGTGPFTVVDFRANDVVLFEANPTYRDAGKPAFASVELKGGGDAAAAARAVLETGETDYAWNLQVEPEILAAMEAAGQGEVLTARGTLIERILLNPFAVDPSLNEARSTADAGPHPIFKDPVVGRAMSIALDRALITELGYGAAAVPTCNIVNAPAVYASPNTDWCMTPDVEEANRLLDEAGYARGPDGIRTTPEGARMSIIYQTSTNSVRQGTQALVKQIWQNLGIETELRNIESGVFFGSDPGSPDTFQKFYVDVQMYANKFDGSDPEAYMAAFMCDKFPSPANNWNGQNDARICIEEYDALAERLARTADREARASVVIAMNDLLVNSGHVLPIVHRGDVSGRSLSLGGVRMNAFDSELWNAADWYRED